MQDKAELKKQVRELKVQRDGALERGEHQELKKVRRQIRSLKRQLRMLARRPAVESKATGAPPVDNTAPSASPETLKETGTADAPEPEPSAQETSE